MEAALAAYPVNPHPQFSAHVQYIIDAGHLLELLQGSVRDI